MPGLDKGYRTFAYDFFVSRRASAAGVAKEVAEVLEESGYRVIVQDFDFSVGSNFVSSMQRALTDAKHFIGLLTEDYVDSPYTRAEWTNFFALSAQSGGARRLIILRVDDVSPPGLLAAIVYGDLHNVTAPLLRREIILDAAQGRSRGIRKGPLKFRGVPPTDPHFVGRINSMAAIDAAFEANRSAHSFAPVVLHGLGGTGKSSLAAEYAHRAANEYAGVWWAPAENRTVLMASLSDLAFSLDRSIVNEGNIEKVARTGLSKLSESPRPWLLVYDNVMAPADIVDLVPSRGANVLITTQFVEWGGRAHELEIAPLDCKSAAKFLARRASSRTYKGVLRLAERLGRLPLALDHAGAYIKVAEIDFVRYAELLNVFIKRTPTGSKYSSSVAATFELALQRAANDCPHAETLITYLAVFGSDRIPIYLLQGVALNEVDRSDALASLVRMSVAKRDRFPNGAAAFSIHRLVQLFVRERTPLTEEIVKRAIGALVRAYPRDEYGKSFDRPRHQQILPHAISVLQQCESLKIDVDLMWGLRELVQMLQQVAANVDVEEQLRRAIALSKKTLGLKHLETSERYQDLANFLRDQGQHGDAEQYYRLSLDIATTSLDPRDSALALRRSVLAELLSTMGKVKEANQFAKEAYGAIIDEIPGDAVSSRTKIQVLNTYANVLRESGKNAKSEAILREAINLGEKHLGRSDRYVAVCMNNLAYGLMKQRNYDEAAKFFEAALESKGDGIGGVGRKHLSFAITASNLAECKHELGRPQEAETLHLKAIEVAEQTDGGGQPYQARFRTKYSRYLLAVGRTSDAKTEGLRALASHDNLLGPGHRWTKDAATALANAHSALDEDEAARQVEDRYSLKLGSRMGRPIR